MEREIYMPGAEPTTARRRRKPPTRGAAKPAEPVRRRAMAARAGAGRRLAAIRRNLNQVLRVMNAGRILCLRRSTVRAAVQRVEEVDAAVRRVERAIVEEMAQWS